LTQRTRVFPVYEDDRENIIGILMAKDLLKLQRAPELNIRALLRPAVFVPESKGLNDLLQPVSRQPPTLGHRH
jgi:magnesium and cobalt transporter